MSWLHRRSLAVASANLPVRSDSFFRSALSSCVLLGSRVQLSQQKSPALKYVQDNVLLENQLRFEAYFSTRRTKETPMPYPAGHRAAVKRIIIDSARKLFNRYEFENVSLHQIMSVAVLTHTDFYTYLKSKSDLYAEG